MICLSFSASKLAIRFLSTSGPGTETGAGTRAGTGADIGAGVTTLGGETGLGGGEDLEALFRCCSCSW